VCGRLLLCDFATLRLCQCLQLLSSVAFINSVFIINSSLWRIGQATDKAYLVVSASPIHICAFQYSLLHLIIIFNPFHSLVPCSSIHWYHVLLFTGTMFFYTLVPCSSIIHWYHVLLYTGTMFFYTLVPCSSIIHWYHVLLPFNLLLLASSVHTHSYTYMHTNTKKHTQMHA